MSAAIGRDASRQGGKDIAVATGKKHATIQAGGDVGLRAVHPFVARGGTEATVSGGARATIESGQAGRIKGPRVVAP